MKSEIFKYDTYPARLSIKNEVFWTQCCTKVLFRAPSIRERKRIVELSLDRSTRPHDFKSIPSDRGYETQSHPDDTDDSSSPAQTEPPLCLADITMSARLKSANNTLPLKSNYNANKPSIDTLPIDPNTGNWKSQSVMELNNRGNNHQPAILSNNQSTDELKVR